MSKEKAQTKYLPLHMKPIFELFAHKQCVLKGFKEGTKEYQEAFDTFFYTYNYEAYVHTLSTGEVGKDLTLGILARNPSTPKIKEDYFDLKESLFGKNGYFESLKDGNNESEAYYVLNYKRRLRGIIASLCNLILETKYELDVKRPKSSKATLDNHSSFEYPPSDGTETENMSKKTEAVLNNYLRLYYASEIVNFVDAIFKSDNVVVEDLVKEALNINLDEIENKFGTLNPSEVRKKFTKYFMDKTSIPKVLQNPMRKNSIMSNPHRKTIICPLFKGIVFDYNKVKEFAKSRPDVQIDPNPTYLKGTKIREDQIENADLKEPCIFGTYIDDKGEKNIFLLLGHAEMMSAIRKGYPIIDAVRLNIEQTRKCVVKIN